MLYQRGVRFLIARCDFPVPRTRLGGIDDLTVEKAKHDTLLCTLSICSSVGRQAKPFMIAANPDKERAMIKASTHNGLALVDVVCLAS